MLVGSALGLATGITLGCLQEDDFVSEYAAEVCRMVRDCGRELHLPGSSDVLPATGDCEAIVRAHYSSCGSSCVFNRDKARRCLRRLRDNHCPAGDDGTATDGTGTVGTGDDAVGDETAGDGTATDGTASDGTASDDGAGGLNSDIFGDGLIPIVCSAVYEQCSGGEDQDTRCSAPSGCSIGSGAGGGWLALLGLVLLGTRRRWYLDRR